MLLFAKVLLFCQYSIQKSKMLQLKGTFLQYFSCYPGAGLCVGAGVVVTLQVVAAGSSDGVELVVEQMGKAIAGGD